MVTNHREIALGRAPEAQLLVLRDQAELYLYKLGSDGKYRRRKFAIAVGRVGDATPSGAYFLDAKSRKPAWFVPKHPDYPEEIWHTSIPFEDPQNPFAGGFISISGGNGVGIHGVRFDPELKTTGRASHGCIRVAVSDLEYLYDAAPLGSPVIIL